MESGSEQVKRLRKSNFSSNETDLLICHVAENHTVLSSSFTSTITSSRKHAIWEEVATKIKATCGTQRTAEELRKKWNDLKCQTKKKQQKLKRGLQQTGGGPPPTQLNELEQKVLSLIPQCQLDGIQGGMETGMHETVTEMAGTPESMSLGMPSDQHGISMPLQQTIPSMAVEPSTSQQTLPEAAAEPSIGMPLSGGSNSKQMKQKQGTIISLVEIEKRKVEILEERLLVERERLAEERARRKIEEERLIVERRRLAVDEKLLALKEGKPFSPPFSLSPEIKFM